jgi:putative heme iron utilization protein
MRLALITQPAARLALGRARCGPVKQLAAFRGTVVNTFRQSTTRSRANDTCICSASSIPDSPSTAKTIVDLAAYGTLSTLSSDQLPLGTYVTYVLDQVGQPILRLRKDAIHTKNLMKNPRCSLFVQPAEYPAHLLARVTLIGSVEPVSQEIAESAAALHKTLHSGGVGVDEPRDDDLYYRMVVEDCFYVGQLSGDSAAEVVPGDDYRSADPDPMRSFASSLVKSMNEDRIEDVIRVCAQEKGVSMDDVYFGEMAWIDKKGVYMRASLSNGEKLETIRVDFDRDVIDERDARSALTMIAQVSWEKDKPYQPVPVVPVADADKVEA